ncbi:MAG: aldo/keto reductase [Verrucomicrobia bacterium]|nr:aldo/keto reductase [Verrucomicrobiota bacterium]
MTTSSHAPVSAIGFGGATFGREIDEATAFALLDYAREKGVTHLDTAVAYGNGKSEEIIGRWLASRRPAGMSVATKALPPYSPVELAAAIDLSLRRLGSEAIDLFYLHRWDVSLGDEGLAVLENARQAGKLARAGITNIAPVTLAAVLERQQALGYAPFEVLQCNQNYAVTEMVPDMQAICAKHRLEVVTFSPLGAGFLTGKHQSGVVAGSRFDVSPGHQAIYFQPVAQQRLQRLQTVAARTGFLPEQLALAWALRRPGVSTVLVGGRTTAHLDQALAAQRFQTLPALAELEEADSAA